MDETMPAGEPTPAPETTSAREAAPSTERRLPAVEQLAERFSAAARATVVFGEPVVREDVTVIPVARARWALGGGWGSGQGAEGGGSGGGAGGGLAAEPAGYIEIREGRTTYRPVIDPLAWTRTALVGGLIGLLISRLLPRRR